MRRGDLNSLGSRARSFKRLDSGTDTLIMVPPSAARRAGDEISQSESAGFVLLVDDEQLLLRSLQRILVRAGYETALADSAEAAEPFLDDPRLGVVLVDLQLGQSSGLELLERIKRTHPEIEVIVMTGHGSIESAVGCIQRGA